MPSLIGAASRGDIAAFESLYQLTAPKLFAVVLRITCNRAVAEEVLQETYLNIWQKAERFSVEAGQPMPWLVTIARNKAIDRIRADRVLREQTSGDESLIERLEQPGGTDPGSRESLRVCLGELDDEARRCVVLAYCSGYSREDLANRFSRPVGTIKTLLHRSIKLLRACLERE